MKVYKYVLLTGNGVLPVVGCILLWTQIADNHASFLCFGYWILSVFSEKICDIF